MDHPHVEPLSRFLHSAAWEAHLVHDYPLVHRDTQTDALFTQILLPLKGSFWRGSRVPVPEDWKLPDLPGNPWFVRIQPDTLAAEQALRKTCAGKLRTVRRAIQPPQTIAINLQRPEEEILHEMHQKHRYNIRLATKSGVTVEVVSSHFVTEFKKMWELIEKTSERHGIRNHDRPHYESIVQSLQSDHMVHLAFAYTADGAPAAGALLVECDGVLTYLHGGSDYELQVLKAPFLLHWEIMRWAQRRGIATYDLWGVNTRDGKPMENHPSYGTTRFKIGFGGTLVRYPRTYDIILRPFWYSLYRLGQTFRRTPPSFNDQ